MNIPNIRQTRRAQVKVVAVPEQQNSSFEISFNGTPGEIITHNITIGLRGMGWTPQPKWTKGEKTVWEVNLPAGELVSAKTIKDANRVINQAFGLQ